MKTTEEKFEIAMREICDESRSIGYVPVRFEQMLQRWGALETAKKLLESEPEQDGLRHLRSRGRLDLSLEYVVLKPEFRPLFTKEQLDVAQWRLSKSNFNPTFCEGQ